MLEPRKNHFVKNGNIQIFIPKQWFTRIKCMDASSQNMAVAQNPLGHLLKIGQPVPNPRSASLEWGVEGEGAPWVILQHPAQDFPQRDISSHQRCTKPHPGASGQRPPSI